MRSGPTPRVRGVSPGGIPALGRWLALGAEAGDDDAMAKSRGGPRFFKRRGDELTVKDGDGNKHHATLERVDADTTQEDGSFVLGYCKSCDWTGPARRARDKARKDALAHADGCPSKGQVRLGVSDDELR